DCLSGLIKLTLNSSSLFKTFMGTSLIVLDVSLSLSSSVFALVFSVFAASFISSISMLTSTLLLPGATTPSGKSNSTSTVPDSFISPKSISFVFISLISSKRSLEAKTSTSSTTGSADFNEYPSDSEPVVETSIGTDLLGLSTGMDTSTTSGSTLARNSLPCPSYTLTGTSRLLMGSVRLDTST